MSDQLEDIDVRIGGTIRALREKKGLTRADLAQRCWMSGAELESIESGEKRATAQKLIALAEGLNCPISDIFEIRKSADGTNPEWHMRLISLFERLTDTQQAKVLAMIEAFLTGKRGD